MVAAMKRRMAATLSAFALAAVPSVLATTSAHSSNAAHHAPANDTDSKLAAAGITRTDIYLFVSTVFSFHNLSEQQMIMARKNASDAAIDLALSSRADYDALSCLGKRTQNGLVYVLPKASYPDARVLLVSGDYHARLQSLVKPTTGPVAACRQIAGYAPA
jgi:hypothetical protein